MKRLTTHSKDVWSCAKKSLYYMLRIYTEYYMDLMKPPKVAGNGVTMAQKKKYIVTACAIESSSWELMELLELYRKLVVALLRFYIILNGQSYITFFVGERKKKCLTCCSFAKICQFNDNWVKIGSKLVLGKGEVVVDTYCNSDFRIPLCILAISWLSL